ncbi:MAG: hypothetical protein H7X97_06600 [Opitutaceae bacterium]|nr:hypothetical protein [Verrucomicrobiales bacterium]
MNRHYLLSVLALVSLVGCGEKDVTKLTPKDEVSVLQEAFPATPGAAAAEAPQAYTAYAFGGTAEPSAYVEAAATAIKVNDHASAIFILQNLNSKTNLSGKQYMAIHEGMQVLQADLIRRAERGDAKAKQDIEVLKSKLRLH